MCTKYEVWELLNGCQMDQFLRLSLPTCNKALSPFYITHMIYSTSPSTIQFASGSWRVTNYACEGRQPGDGTGLAGKVM